MRFYESGNYAACDAELERLARDDAANAHLYALERGIVKLALAQPKEGERLLQDAARRMDEIAKRSFREWFGAMFADDTQLDYNGEDYEHVMVRAILALANLMGDGRDAEAYANSVLEKQLEIMESFADESGDKPKQAYKLVGFGAYLRGIMAEESPLKIDVARQEFQRLQGLEPGYPNVQDDLQRLTSGKHSEKGNGVVHVLALVGRGPYKVEVDEVVTAAALAIAQVIWGIYRERVTFPNISTIKIPALVCRRDNPTAVEVAVDGAAAGATVVVTDVDATAMQHFETMKASIMARAVVRRAFKIVAVEAAREAINRNRDPLVDLAASVGGLVWTAVERADTRGWVMLPATFQALRLELPAGEHEIAVRPVGSGGPSGRQESVRVQVRDGFNGYVFALVPTLGGGPPPLTSAPAAAASAAGVN